MRQFSGLQEDDIALCRFLLLIHHCLVKPPVDFPGDFARAGRPEAEVVVLGPDKVTFRHCLTLDERDHGEVYQEPEGLLQVVGETVFPQLHLVEEPDVRVQAGAVDGPQTFGFQQRAVFQLD